MKLERSEGKCRFKRCLNEPTYENYVADIPQFAWLVLSLKAGSSQLWRLILITPRYVHLKYSVCSVSLSLHQVARKNIELAGLSDRVEVITGPALDVLPTLGPNHSFDFAFIDADKPSNPGYFKQAQRLVKSGTYSHP